MRRWLWIVGLLFLTTNTQAGTATLSWDAYSERPTFTEFKVYRGAGSLCGSSAVMLTPLLKGTVPVAIPKGTPTPTTYLDTTAPDTPGMLCYELTAVDTINGVRIESKRSNRAIKFVESPVPAPVVDVQ